MKYIIMCGGEYGWMMPRQMTKVCGEHIVARTIRLLRAEGIEDISISTKDKRFLIFNVPLLEHDNSFKVDKNNSVKGCWADGFYPTSEPACYIMGDVVFSPDAIRTIVHTEVKSVQFFASTPPFSSNYIKPWGEPFAFKVVDQKRFRAAIDFVRANVNTGIFRRPPISWELWQVLNGFNTREINYDSIFSINDYTCDIDKPEDAKEIEAVICKL